MVERWRPFSERLGERDLTALTEGVPEWLMTSLSTWVRGRVWREDERDFTGRVVTLGGIRQDLMLRMDRALRSGQLRPVVAASSGIEVREALLTRCRRHPDLFLDVVDFLLSELRAPKGVLSGPALALEQMLAEAGSAYQVAVVGEDRVRLEPRIDATVRMASESIMGAGDRAAEHLRQAWEALYGRDPSPGEGYREAVRALEAAAKPVISPKDGDATLGKMIPAFKDAPQKWTIALDHSGAEEAHSAVLAMLRMIWTNEHDRHGTDDDSVPLNVSLDEARAALHLAMTLVQWFRSGAIALAP